MKLALSAHIRCDPKKLQNDRWAHDTAHALLDSVLKAQAEAGQPKRRRRR